MVHPDAVPPAPCPACGGIKTVLSGNGYVWRCDLCAPCVTPWRPAAVAITAEGLAVVADDLRLAFTPNQVAVAAHRASRPRWPFVFPDDVLFDCPACDHRMVTHRAGVGGTTRCPACRQRVIVPDFPVLPVPA